MNIIMPYVGMLMECLFIASWLPQIYRTYTCKSVKDLSPHLLWLSVFASVLGMLYTHFYNQYILEVGYGANFLSSSILLCLYLVYRK
jgi:uncharacterized protein with PQ loop repeat